MAVYAITFYEGYDETSTNDMHTLYIRLLFCSCIYVVYLVFNVLLDMFLHIMCGG